jgi:SAM-dependent methyltransferase
MIEQPAKFQNKLSKNTPTNWLMLEFGCGLGTTSDFLARFVPGGSNVVCVEPEPMIGEVFGEGSDVSKQFPFRPVQLSMLSFSPEAKTCSDKLFDPEMGFELVLSLEVAEHVPAEFTAELIQRLARATSKYLVFSAARPSQGGTGHIDESMHKRKFWIDQFTNAHRGEQGKLHYLPQLSLAMRHVTAWPERAYDFGTNLIALGAPGVEDMPDIPQIAHDCFFKNRGKGPTDIIRGDAAEQEYIKEHNLTAILEVARPCPGVRTEDEKKQRQYWVEGQSQALWPELDLLIRRVKSGELTCG